MPYQCQFHDGIAEASVLLTTLANGQTMASCTEDAPVMLVGALAQALGVDTGRLWDVIRRHAARETKASASAPPAAPQAPPAEIQGTCPHCEATVSATPDLIEQAAADHLQVCPKAPEADRVAAP
jgi:hypothetical protein